ncbi:hypothetical protein PBY51_017035 [Eleginops maclovinus]|uniref:Uncharacterized protein n=1 Tax=Eleginops maclovinus TaxID=56733 RepID=A0AAN8AAM0_ELEMC|nr:hypothetical protein PBY51_017035 [Eleginops maclovinus]
MKKTEGDMKMPRLPSSRGARYDLCALGLPPVEERLSTLCEAFLTSAQPERMNGFECGLPPRRIVLHASV